MLGGLLADGIKKQILCGNVYYGWRHGVGAVCPWLRKRRNLYLCGLWVFLAFLHFMTRMATG